MDNSKKNTVIISGMSKNCSKSGWAETEKFLAVELRLLGFRTLNLDTEICSGSESTRHLLKKANINNAVCAIQLRVDKNRKATVEIWIHHSKSSKMTFYTYEIDTPVKDSNSQTAALKIIERFRVSLVELVKTKLEKKPSGSRKTEKPGKAEIKPAKPLNPNFGIDNIKKGSVNKNLERKRFFSYHGSAFSGIWYSPGGLPALFYSGLAAGFRFKLFEFETAVLKSLYSRDITGPDATATWSFWDFSTNLNLVFTRGSLGIIPGLGVGFHHIISTGFDYLNDIKRTDSKTVLSLNTKLKFEFRINKWITFNISAKLSVFNPQIRVLFRSEEIASVGFPALELNTGISFFIF